MPTVTPPPAPVELTLAIAMVASAGTPVLLLDGSLDVVAASHAFCRAFGIDPAKVNGRPVFSLGTGEWDSPRLSSLLTGVAAQGVAIADYELDLKTRDRGDRRLSIAAHKLDYDDKAAVRLYVAITDVTDARANDRLRDDLVREKSVLMQEMQHRVANSLQIIASVLMQSARTTQSDDLRNHLTNAHNRVMSVAQLQRQLAVTHLGEVAMRPYLGQLCQSIGASMIFDHDLVRIDVEVDDSTMPPDASVSVGLIVTELVINALKHAFPDQRHGVVAVDYNGGNAGWQLTIADDGVGMKQNTPPPKAGLGTTIVGALAKQLHATITVTEGNPGTKVTVKKPKLRLVEGGPREADAAAV